MRDSRTLQDQVRTDNESGYRLINTTPGRLNGLRMVPLERRVPGAQEVEVKVHATGLAFRDVLSALGMYPGGSELLGIECAGSVTAVGARVSGLRVGDSVFGLAPGSFASHVTTPASFVALRPTGLSMAAAAAIPSSFVTAHYALEVLGFLRAGQRVLIHSATGGVGQLALQIARGADAQVFATAGSDAKRHWLRQQGVEHVLNSRNLSFVEEIHRLTGGRGVDLVLNCLAGPFIPASFSVLAGDGCFLELGKRRILGADEAARLRPGGRYFVVDFGELGQHKPGIVGALLQTLLERLSTGTITAPTLELFSLSRVVDAFKHMAAARHIGRIVTTDTREAQ
jgi:NADPH:quinone reductase-like Zn-dependent oxidoreductase